MKKSSVNKGDIASPRSFVQRQQRGNKLSINYDQNYSAFLCMEVQVRTVRLNCLDVRTIIFFLHSSAYEKYLSRQSGHNFCTNHLAKVMRHQCILNACSSVLQASKHCQNIQEFRRHKCQFLFDIRTQVQTSAKIHFMERQ